MAKKKQSKAYQKKRQKQRAKKSAQRRRKQSTRQPLPSASKQAPFVVDETDLNQFMMILMTSDILADEPEFEEILIAPMLCTQSWMEAIAAKGISPEDFDKLPEDKQDDFKQDVMEAILKRVLTSPLRQQIIDAADALQSRYDETGNMPGFMQASAVHIYLDAHKKAEDWALVGLVHALVHRSLDITFELDQVLDVDPSVPQDDGEREKILDGIMKKYPGFSKYISEELDDLLDRGLDKMFDGEWYFGIFSSEELESAVEAFQIEDEPDLDVEARITGQVLPNLTGYLRDILTSDRVKQMENHLRKLEQTTNEEQSAFLSVLLVDLKMFDPLDDYLMPTLLKIFLGELRSAGILKVEGEDDEG